MSIIDYIKIYIWPTWGNLICVIIGAAISYYSIKIRENKKLKLDLQIKASKAFTEAFEKFRDSLFFFECKLQTIFYNNSIKCKEDLFKECGLELKSDNPMSYQSHAMAIFKKTGDTINHIHCYHNNLLSIVILLESQEIVFNRFVGIRKVLLAKHDELYAISNEIIRIMQNDVAECVHNQIRVNEKIIDIIGQHEQDIIKVRSDIDAILYDISVEVQNEFLGKLFRYKVPYRKPMDKSLTVYKAGYKHIEK